MGASVKVSAVIPTRGNVDMQPILDSLPSEWEKIVWDNSPLQTVAPSYIFGADLLTVVGPRAYGGPDLSVYGRYAAIEYATHDLIYVQDDDVIVSDPQAIVDELIETFNEYALPVDAPGLATHVVCNMPPEFRHDFYREHALVGFGAAFHRDAPARAFRRFWQPIPPEDDYTWEYGWRPHPHDAQSTDPFLRCCDVVFTALTPRVLVDVAKENLPYATGPDRMYRQAQHQGERARMLELALKVRDA